MARARAVRLIDWPFVKVADAVALAGHEVHVCRYREARTLLRWLGEDQDRDLRGLRVLDVPGGDGYWAGQARKRGARAVARGLARLEYRYQFRSRRAERMYLGLSAYGGKFGFNAAAPATPLVAASDRAAREDGGAIVLIRARHQGPREGRHAASQGGSVNRGVSTGRRVHR